MTDRTAIIEKIKIGKVDHYTEIMVSCDMNMDGCGTTLIFSIPQIKEMMEDVGIYDNMMNLVGNHAGLEVVVANDMSLLGCGNSG